MHRYTQNILRRVLDASKKPKGWTEDSIRRFALECYNQARSCKCGCGKKTMPSHLKENTKGMTAGKWYSQWFTGSLTNINFYEILPNHNYPFLLTENERQATLASIIGDGYMHKGNAQSKYPRIAWNMGNKKHAEYKKDFFFRFGSTIQEKENPGWGSKWYCVTTKSCPAFVEIFDKYNKKDKALRAELVMPELKEIGWAWLYGDDGHFDKKNGIAYIHTEGLEEEGTKIAAKCLGAFLEIDQPISVQNYLGGYLKKERFCLRL